jgi:transcriptional regulator GlxA family with amidase domain
MPQLDDSPEAILQTAELSGAAQAASGVTSICFLLLDNFSLLSFSSAIEPLRIANKIMKRKAFEYVCCTLDGNDALASSGGIMRADCALDNVKSADLLAICSSDDVELNSLSPAHKNRIRRFAHQKTRIAGICTGAYVLADLGLLEGRQCTIHWEYADLFKERFPKARLIDSLIQTDDHYLTCAGGTTALDLMIGYIADLHGGAVASDVASIALHQDMRSGSERQNTLMRDELYLIPPRLRRCIELMTENVGETLSRTSWRRGSMSALGSSSGIFSTISSVPRSPITAKSGSILLSGWSAGRRCRSLKLRWLAGSPMLHILPSATRACTARARSRIGRRKAGPGNNDC